MIEPVTRIGGKYRFQLIADFEIDLRKGWTGYHDFFDKDSRIAVLDGDKLTIMAGYAFDGCSPAFRIGGYWFGTPTPPATVAAALVHDCLRQFMGVKCAPFTRKDTDDIFYDILKAHKFPLADEYHGAVAGMAGTLFSKLTRRPKTLHCRA